MRNKITLAQRDKNKFLLRQVDSSMDAVLRSAGQPDAKADLDRAQDELRGFVLLLRSQGIDI